MSRRAMDRRARARLLRPATWGGAAAARGVGMLCAVARPLAVAVLSVSVALMCAPAARAQTLIHSERSLYRQIFVYQESQPDPTRCLCFTYLCTIGRQSCIDLTHPYRLVFQYTRMMLGALYLDPDPRRILVIGLGGGTLPRALERLLPNASIDVAEIDPAVLRVAKRYFEFQPDAHVHVFIQDGRVYVRHTLVTSKRYDLIMLDAYGSVYIPEHMLTREFLQEVRSLLAPGGIVAANTFSSSRLYQNESVTYESVFGTFYNLKSANRVILAAKGPLPSMQLAERNSRRFQSAFAAFGFSAQSVLDLFSTRRDWNPHARVLTDQYSPANLLNLLH